MLNYDMTLTGGDGSVCKEDGVADVSMPGIVKKKHWQISTESHIQKAETKKSSMTLTVIMSVMA